MKKLFIALAMALLTLTGCTEKELTEAETNDEEPSYVVIKQSDDKHISYMKNYVGKNLATVGYTSMGGDRNDYLGEDIITLWIQTLDGHYVDVEDEEVLKQYVVVSQGYEPNTEVRFEYEVDEDGEEGWYPYFSNFQYMVIQVRKLDDKTKFKSEPLCIKLADDKYTRYMPDLKGLNLAAVGYTSIAGDKRMYLGDSNIRLNIIAKDGSYIDVSDNESLKNYIIVGQNVEPNTPVKFSYDSSYSDEESLYSTWKSLDEVDIYVENIN